MVSCAAGCHILVEMQSRESQTDGFTWQCVFLR